MTWQAIIQRAAATRFARAGLIDVPFKLARSELFALVNEIHGTCIDLSAAFRVQARVYVPELEAQVLVDEWTPERAASPSPAPVVDSPP